MLSTISDIKAWFIENCCILYNSDILKRSSVTEGRDGNRHINSALSTLNSEYLSSEEYVQQQKASKPYTDPRGFNFGHSNRKVDFERILGQRTAEPRVTRLEVGREEHSGRIYERVVCLRPL